VKMWLYKPWVDKLGLEWPETTEDFYNVLKAFKEQDPNGNGKADEVPLLGATTSWRTDPFGFLMNSFVYTVMPQHLNNYGSFLERDGDQTQASPVTRLKRLLHRFMHANDTLQLNKEVHLRLPLDRRELAGLIAVSVTQLSALLGQLQRDRLIELRRDRLVILDPIKLRAADPTARDVGWPLNAG